MATKYPPLESIEWAEKHQPSAKHDLCSSGVFSISVSGLVDISEGRKESEERLALNTLGLEQNEAPSNNLELRRNLANLYSARSAGVSQENILITNGAGASNYAVFSALLAPGDHVICQHPVDELLYKIPKSSGADVTLWTTELAKKWQIDLEELKQMIKDNTKMIVIQSPCDPTGAIVSKPTLEALVEIAEEKGIMVLADESYRPLFHSISPSSADFPPSTINMGYRRVIVTGTTSKAYSLAGIKAGWVASKDLDILDACARSIVYASLAASKVDEAVAAEATSDRCIHALLGRNITLCRTNLDLLQGFIEEHSWACSWVRPLAGTTAMLKFHKMGKPVDDEAFCLALLEHTGLLVCPASKCFGDSQKFRGYIRVAFGGSEAEMKAALAAWTSFMEEKYEGIPTVSAR
ncbi:aminotransferase [Exophiala viscosa]|uniref:Aminotransferase n=1 Tax=Exophiala viscosa TaxID=2486360 RepID=A0AAN6DZU5_9EURO|nr:aminotransferase [Exophiala viscosa]KAI1621484.1 aminotransferase [Exophiala viscosa]